MPSFVYALPYLVPSLKQLELGSLTAQTLSTFHGHVSRFGHQNYSSLLLICVVFRVGGQPVSPLWKGLLNYARDWEQCSCFAHSDSFVYSLVADIKVFRVLPVAGITMHFCLA